MKVAQSCRTLCDPMDYTVCGILQARILEWVAVPFPEDLPNQGIEPRSPSLIAQLVKNPPAMQETLVASWVRKIPWRRDRLPTLVFLSFPGGSASKESTCNLGDLGLIPGLGRSPGEGKGYPLQYSGLENSTYCVVHGVTKSRT